MICMTFFCSCNDKRDHGEREAADLLAQARSMIDSENFVVARQLIDSIRSAYPRAFDVRKEAIEVLDILEMKEAMKDMAVDDSASIALAQKLDEMKKGFLLEKDPRYQTVGFYKDKQQPASALHRTCLYAEVDETGQMFLISVITGKKIKHDRISVETSSGESMESPLCFSFVTDNSAGYEEQATFKRSTDNDIAAFIENNADKAIFIQCRGSEGNHRYQLSKADIQSIARCCQLERTIQEAELLKRSSDSLKIKAKFFTKKRDKDRQEVRPAVEKTLPQERP